MKKKLIGTAALSLASLAGSVGIGAGAASAASTVYAGGFATCASPIGSIAASSVSVWLDSGGYASVGTSALPWQKGLYRMSFSSMPSAGTGAWVLVRCNNFTSHPGDHWYRTSYKPDWRNTTGDRNFLNV